MPPTIDVTGKTPAQLLAEARALLDRRPRSLEVMADIESRRIAAAWLITEADWLRASAALDAQSSPAAERVVGVFREFEQTARRMTAGASNESTVDDECPSRMLAADGQEIRHCSGKHFRSAGLARPLKHNDGGAWSWSDDGAMPAEKPCDKRCARCVERVREAVIEQARRLANMAGAHRFKLHDAVREYEKVMGL